MPVRAKLFAQHVTHGYNFLGKKNLKKSSRIFFENGSKFRERFEILNPTAISIFLYANMIVFWCLAAHSKAKN